MQIFKASLETRNFSFEAFGETEDAARLTLVEGFGIHAKQYQLGKDWWHQFSEDIVTMPLVMDACYRDRQVLR